MKANSDRQPLMDLAPKPNTKWSAPSSRRIKRFIRQNRISLLVLLGIVFIGCLPYKLRPGGKVELLPLNKQNIQVKVSGRIDKIMVNGGNRSVIPAGKVIATMAVPNLENQLEVVQKKIETKNADLRVSQREIKVAENQLLVTLTQLDKASVRAKFSKRSAIRVADLYKSGAVSLQYVEDYQKLAETEASNVIELEKTVLQKQQEVHRAEDRIAIAEGELQRLNQELKFTSDEIRRANITMPFKGVITDDDLKGKIGTYLAKGSTFATAEASSNRELRARIQVSQVVADNIKVGKKVVFKLLAFPNDPVQGKVVAINPSVHILETQQTEAEDTGNKVNTKRQDAFRLLGVIATLPNQNGRLRPGMTGYAKIEGESVPLAVAFSRSLTRFFKVEVWSWLP